MRGLPASLETFDGAGLTDDLEGLLRGADELVDQLKERARNASEAALDHKAHTGVHSPSLAKLLRDTEARLAEAEEALRSLTVRQEALTGATLSARVQTALEALRQPPSEVSVPVVNLALRRVFNRAVIIGQEVPKLDRGGERTSDLDWRWWAISFEWKHGGECLVPITNFKPLVTGADPGWVWQGAGE